MFGLTIRGEFRFKLLYETTAGKSAAVDHVTDRAVKFSAVGLMVGLQIKKLDAHGGW
jgi:hypothetical protein